MANTTGKKFGGRKKGTPNKTATEIREAFQLLVTMKLPNLSKWIDEVAENNPEKALDIIAKYSEFVLPKLQRSEINGSILIKKMTVEEREARIIELSNKLKKVQ